VDLWGEKRIDINVREVKIKGESCEDQIREGDQGNGKKNLGVNR
jgi:hypothetical protein